MLDLVNKSFKEKANIKSKEIAKIKIGKFTKNNFEIELVGDIKEIDGGVEFFAKAFKGNKQLGFSKDGSVEIERFRFYNPPILVSDNNGDIEREEYNPITEVTTIKKFRYDPEEALKQSLEHTISIVGKEDTEIIKDKRGNTTSTFYPAAGANEPVEGYVGRINVGDTWSQIRDGAGTESADTPTTNYGPQQGHHSVADQYSILRRLITLFDTAAIGTDTIDSATLSRWWTSRTNNYNGGNYNVLATSDPASTDALVNADYLITDFGTTELFTRQAWSAITLNQYEDWTLNANGEAAINGAGLTKFGVLCHVDFDDSVTWQSSLSDFLASESADVAGTTHDPKLVVEHTEVTGSTSDFLQLF